MDSALAKLSNQMIPEVEAEIRDVFRFRTGEFDKFFGMMHYHMGWVDEKLEAIDVQSGKRIRPLLCLLSCAASGGDWRRAVPAAASIEIIHNFSLVHDDIQDESPTRRGRSTVWRIWGVNQAINTGDAMFALAHTAMSRLLDRGVAAEITVRALQMLDDSCLELTRGQFSDMHFEGEREVSVEEYLSMIGRKTAALISLSTELGSLIGGGNLQMTGHYAAFGSDLGLAFQIRDDILGIWGDESVIGKSAATDIAARKKSLPVLHGLSKSSDLRRQYFDEQISEEFVDRVVELLGTTGSREFSEAYERSLADSAVAHLETVEPKGEAGRALFQLTGQLLNREF